MQIHEPVSAAVLDDRTAAVPLHGKIVPTGIADDVVRKPVDGETIRGRRKEPAVAKGQDARLHGQIKNAHASSKRCIICARVLSAAGNGTFRCDGDGSETGYDCTPFDVTPE
ncbi:MAG: hypothetical protein ACLTFL_17855 [Bacteroides thetaiotaomicron]